MHQRMRRTLRLHVIDFMLHHRMIFLGNTLYKIRCIFVYDESDTIRVKGVCGSILNRFYDKNLSNLKINLLAV